MVHEARITDFDMDAQAAVLQETYQAADPVLIAQELQVIPVDTNHEYVNHLKTVALRLQLADLFSNEQARLAELQAGRPYFMRPGAAVAASNRFAKVRLRRYADRIDQHMEGFDEEYDARLDAAKRPDLDVQPIVTRLQAANASANVIALLAQEPADHEPLHNQRSIRQMTEMIKGAIASNMFELSSVLADFADKTLDSNMITGAQKADSYLFATAQGYLEQAVADLLSTAERHHDEPAEPITSFRGKHYFLSNMYPLAHGIQLAGDYVAPTVEHAYQAAKFPDIASIVTVLAAEDGIAAKRAAHALIKDGNRIHTDWNERRVDVMRHYVAIKFAQDPELRAQLVRTGNSEIIEGNNWGDTFWGQSPEKSGNGLNWLGIILMEARRQYSTEQ